MCSTSCQGECSKPVATRAAHVDWNPVDRFVEMDVRLFPVEEADEVITNGGFTHVIEAPLALRALSFGWDDAVAGPHVSMGT